MASGLSRVDGRGWFDATGRWECGRQPGQGVVSLTRSIPARVQRATAGAGKITTPTGSASPQEHLEKSVKSDLPRIEVQAMMPNF